MIWRIKRIWERIKRQRSYNPQAGHRLGLISKARSIQLSRVQRIISVSFCNIGILDQALTHISFANEHKKAGYVSNELLEFFGDAILGFLITERLLKEHPSLREGRLSKARSFIVSTNNLATKANSCNLGSYLRFGQGEEMSGGRTKSSLLANAYEALICAIYLDRGMQAAKRFIAQQFINDFTARRINSHLFDYKTKLQEFTQDRWGIIPHYILAGTIGPDHNKRFCIALKIDNQTIGRGKGSTKKKGEQAAARMALHNIVALKDSVPDNYSRREYVLALKQAAEGSGHSRNRSAEV